MGNLSSFPYKKKEKGENIMSSAAENLLQFSLFSLIKKETKKTTNYIREFVHALKGMQYTPYCCVLCVHCETDGRTMNERTRDKRARDV